jgi:pyruvate dehydrogenase E2 component (dihydrolipoamide acetyltransferase)
MAAAKKTIPHFRLSADIEVDRLLKYRTTLRTQQESSPTMNDLLIKACAAALMDVPALNVNWADGEIRQYASADISVVVGLEGAGIVTPIVRHAESKTVWEIASEVKELSARAARNALKMHEIVGGSFSISNLGMYGVHQFDAIINAPQCAILAVGSAKPQVTVSLGEIRIATLMRVTLSMDHRAIDGIAGASFILALRRRLEQPEHMHSTVNPS